MLVTLLPVLPKPNIAVSRPYVAAAQFCVAYRLVSSEEKSPVLENKVFVASVPNGERFPPPNITLSKS